MIKVSLAGEGGPISIVPTTQQTFSAVHLPSIPDNFDAEENIARTGNTQSKIVSRKGASLPNQDLGKTNLSSEKEPLTGNVKPISESDSTSENAHKSQLNNSTSANIQSFNITVKHTDELSNSHSNKTSPDDKGVTEQKSMTNTSMKTNPTPKKHKPKPTATVVNSRTDDEKPMPAMPTRSSPLGMPRKIDYIIPVIITIVALPLLGAATFMVYRRGRDCWDKRHYRRMDFLIDGMYND